MKRRRCAAVAAGTVLAGLLTSASGAGATTPPASSGHVFTLMNGARELKPDGTRRNGDPDGWGSFTASITGNQLCFGITVAGLDTPTGAHIHKAPATANGPVVIALTAPASGDPGASSGCVTADPMLLADIAAHPPHFYVNIHTATYPSGAIRGQLFKA